MNYEPSQSYMDAIVTNDQAPYSGYASYEAVAYDGSLDYLAKGCRTVSITYCDWGGDEHTAGPNCTPSYMWTVRTIFCDTVDPSPALINNSNGGTGGNNGSSVPSTPPSDDEIVTTPTIDLGNWLIGALGVGNLNASSENLIIWNWIENNDQHGNELFSEVYEFYTENASVVNIDDIVTEAILILDANPSLTFEEALLEASIVIIDSSDAKKVDPAVELNYFDLTQGAKLIVYVQQPRENSSVLVGPNQVGHAFIGVEQGGIVRQIGYYPDKEVGPTGVGADFDVAIKTNYDYLYHVSISQNISSVQLTNIVNYSMNFPPTYNTNNYACADFAINIGNLGGMNLPSATVSSFLFTGRSPGVLGQEIRAMSSTPTTTMSNVRANSPTRQGGCIGSN
jgi:hypothetical protein